MIVKSFIVHSPGSNVDPLQTRERKKNSNPPYLLPTLSPWGISTIK
jgi:hypothetical protein